MRKSAVLLTGVAFLAAAFSLSCSSAPKAPPGVFESRNEAAQLVQLGAKALREGAVGSARTFYTEAYRLYTATDDAEGRIRALDGLGRLPEADTSKLWQEAARVATESGNKQHMALAALLDAELKLRNADGESAGTALATSIAAANGLSGKPRDRARAFRVAGAAAKALGDYAAALGYLDKAASIDLGEKAFTEYASDRYLAASVQSKRGDYLAARIALHDALEADRRSEHAAGIGGDYYALALIAEKTGDAESAVRFFTRAADVFRAARMEDRAVDAEKRRAALSPSASANENPSAGEK